MQFCLTCGRGFFLPGLRLCDLARLAPADARQVVRADFVQLHRPAGGVHVRRAADLLVGKRDERLDRARRERLAGVALGLQVAFERIAEDRAVVLAVGGEEGVRPLRRFERLGDKAHLAGRERDVIDLHFVHEPVEGLGPGGVGADRETLRRDGVHAVWIVLGQFAVDVNTRNGVGGTVLHGCHNDRGDDPTRAVRSHVGGVVEAFDDRDVAAHDAAERRVGVAATAGAVARRDLEALARFPAAGVAEHDNRGCVGRGLRIVWPVSDDDRVGVRSGREAFRIRREGEIRAARFELRGLADDGVAGDGFNGAVLHRKRGGASRGVGAGVGAIEGVARDGRGHERRGGHGGRGLARELRRDLLRRQGEIDEAEFIHVARVILLGAARGGRARLTGSAARPRDGRRSRRGGRREGDR